MLRVRSSAAPRQATRRQGGKAAATILTQAGGKAAPGGRKLTEREAFVMRHFAGDVVYCVEGECTLVSSTSK